MAAKKTATKKSSGAKKTAGKKATAKKSTRVTKNKMEEVMHEFKRGELKSGGRARVKNPKQAIAIGLSEARRAGGNVPAKKGAKKAGSKKSSSKSAARKSTARKSTAKR